MKTFELFCQGLAIWTLIEGSLIVILPARMRALTLRLFPNASVFLKDLAPSQFRSYCAVEAAFGLLLGGYFFFLA